MIPCELLYEIIHIHFCLNWKIYCDDLSPLSATNAIQILLLLVLSCNSHHFTRHGRYKLNKLNSLPMFGFIAQLEKHQSSIRAGHGFQSCLSPDLFQDCSFELLKLENLLQ